MFRRRQRGLSVLLSSAVFSAAFVGFTGTASAAPATIDSPTLDSIRSSGVISMGVRDNSYPFSYVDDNSHYLGYAMDISNAIVMAIKKRLDMPNLTVKYLPVTSQSRIPLVQNNQIQFECSSTTNNKDRENQVNFSDTYFIIGTRLLVAKSSQIKDFPDLKGKTIVTIAGSTSERILRGLNEKENAHMSIIGSIDAATAFVTLETGRAAAFMMDDAVLAGSRATAHDPSRWVIVGKPASKEAYGCMMPKGDDAFKQLVDQVISERQLSGVQTTSYKKWFMSPTPPKNVNLNFEMNDDIKELNAHPTDKPYQ